MMMTGASAGEVFSLDDEAGDLFVIGRAAVAAVKIDDPSISRQHCQIVRREGRLYVEDLGSRNGTRLNGNRVRVAALSEGDRIQVGSSAVLQLRFVDEVEDELSRRLLDDSTRDPLTGTYNRRYFHRRLEAELSYARRHGTGLACIVLDLDFFKTVNDTYGHVAGDAVLAAVGRALHACVRQEDVVSRFGGEEFSVLARVTSRQEASLFAERLRQCVLALRVALPSKQTISVTISAGVAELGECEAAGGVLDLLALADERLYRAKASGRNQVQPRV
jgi:diguanylate cyclase (GGDEF)-like protein